MNQVKFRVYVAVPEGHVGPVHGGFRQLFGDEHLTFHIVRPHDEHIDDGVSEQSLQSRLLLTRSLRVAERIVGDHARPELGLVNLDESHVFPVDRLDLENLVVPMDHSI